MASEPFSRSNRLSGDDRALVPDGMIEARIVGSPSAMPNGASCRNGERDVRAGNRTRNRTFCENRVGGPSQQDVTQVLKAITAGSREAVDKLLPIVYDELRALADRYLRHDRPDHTLQATALAHEAYLRLVDQREVQWQNRAHFVAVAAQAIRRILADYARMHRREKRGGDKRRVPLSMVAPSAPGRDLDWLALDEALGRLGEQAPIEAQIVEMRFFGGMSIDEIAEVLDVSDRTVRRRWNYAKAWLYREISKGDTQMSDGVLE